jgi:hypothetical protein
MILGALKYAATAATGSHHYCTLEIGHLHVEIMQHSTVEVVCSTGDRKDISILGTPHVDHAKSSCIVEGSNGSKYIYTAVITATTITV